MPKLDLTKPPMTAEDSRRLLEAEDSRIKFWRGMKLFAMLCIVVVAFTVSIRWIVDAVSRAFH